MKSINNGCEIINQYGREYSETPKKIRVACRGIITEGDKILLSHELNTGVYLIPGGGLEPSESLEECCKRELHEETGYEVKVDKPLFTVNEYFRNILYVSNYYVCEIIGKVGQSLTDNEIEHGVVPEWVKFENALKIFGKYAEYASTDEEIEGQYKREYTVISKYINEFC